MLFLCLSNILGKDIAVWRGDVCVVILDGFRDFKPKFLIEVYGVLIVCLNMQVNFRNILLGAQIKRMVQQLFTCTNTKT